MDIWKEMQSNNKTLVPITHLLTYMTSNYLKNLELPTSMLQGLLETGLNSVFENVANLLGYMTSNYLKNLGLPTSMLQGLLEMGLNPDFDVLTVANSGLHIASVKTKLQ